MREVAATPADPAIPQLAPILAAGGPAVDDLMREAEGRLREVAAAHGEELGRHVSLTLDAGGKRMRPLLVFLCAAGRPSAGIVPAAVAVELLHMATLVHDDVLDRAELRRGHRTVFATGGRGAATAAGDLLFSRAFAELAGTGSPAAVRALSGASSALARGELMQRADAFSSRVTVERYLERCALKTGRLFQAACRLGAVLGAPGEAAADVLGAFGDYIGLAFQILDDVLDIAGPTERIGKHRGTDLLDGTVTLPLILARAREPELARIDLRSVARPAAAQELCDRIAATGALDDARRHALEHVDRAKRSLRSMALPQPTVRALELVADAVVDRYA
jgi:geranylgeranyl pyrophosphate synthase